MSVDDLTHYMEATARLKARAEAAEAAAEEARQERENVERAFRVEHRMRMASVARIGELEAALREADDALPETQTVAKRIIQRALQPTTEEA